MAKDRITPRMREVLEYAAAGRPLETGISGMAAHRSGKRARPRTGQARTATRPKASSANCSPHAPAKAREVTEEDVERACVGWAGTAEHWNRLTEATRAAIRVDIRAALATFSEGAETSDERRE